jgi:hypothetical protein
LILSAVPNRYGGSSGGGYYGGNDRERDYWSQWRQTSGNSIGQQFPGGSWGGGFAGRPGSTGVIGGGGSVGYGYQYCDSINGVGGARPVGATGRAAFEKLDVGYRLRRTYVDRYVDAVTADDCMRICEQEPGCVAFNFL